MSMVAMLMVASAVPALAAPTVIEDPSGNNAVFLYPDDGVLVLDGSGGLGYIAGADKANASGDVCRGSTNSCTGAGLDSDGNLSVLFEGQRLFKGQLIF
jgi:hypothetical protein